MLIAGMSIGRAQHLPVYASGETVPTVAPPPPDISGTPTLTLLTRKATPTAQGNGSRATGAFGQTRLGFINSTDTNGGAPATTVVKPWGTVYYGGVAELWQQGNIYITSRINGKIGAGSGVHSDRVYLYGDNVTYLGMLEPAGGLVWSGSRFNTGCQEGEQSFARCLGQTNNIIMDVQVFRESPDIGTPTLPGDYGSNAVWLGSIEGSHIQHITAAYGGDQILDFAGTVNQDVGTFPVPDYYTTDNTLQDFHMFNGYGTGSLGPHTGTESDTQQGYIDRVNGIISNVSHRFPNHSAHQLVDLNEYSRSWNTVAYNWTAPLVADNGRFRIHRFGGGTRWRLSNNLYKRGPDSPADLPLAPGNTDTGSVVFGFQYNPTFAGSSQAAMLSNTYFYITDTAFLNPDGTVQYADAGAGPTYWSSLGAFKYFGGTSYGTAGAQAFLGDGVFESVDPGFDSDPYYEMPIGTDAERDAMLQEVADWAGSIYYCTETGERASDRRALSQSNIDDVLNGSNNSITAGVVNYSEENDATRHASQVIPALPTSNPFTDANENMISDDFETTHGLPEDPFQVTTNWTFNDPDHGTYNVVNTAGYNNLEMFAWYIGDHFYRLIERGEVGTDPTYSITQAVVPDIVINEITAFPGAVGHGRNTTGGRGQTVYRVTNLNDSGAGSLRDAVSQSNRYIVFEVGGTITINTDLQVTGSNLTIDGGTAPGDGIGIYGDETILTGQNVIVRNLRFMNGERPPANEDTFRIMSQFNPGSYSNYIVDHCSIRWASDENLSIESGDQGNVFLTNITVSNSILSDGLSFRNSILYGGNMTDVSIIGNFFGRTQERNIRSGQSSSGTGPGTDPKEFEFYDNYIYGYEDGLRPEDGVTMDAVGNVYEDGFDTQEFETIKLEGNCGGCDVTTSLVYITDNLYNGGAATLGPDATTYNQASPQVPSGYTSIGSAAVKSFVQTNAGARIKISGHDSVDASLVTDSNAGTGSYSDTLGADPTAPTLNPGTHFADADNDHLSDAFETANGGSIIPTDRPALCTLVDGRIVDQTGIAPGSRYTYIELFSFERSGDFD